MLEYAEDQFQCCICTEMIINAVTLNCSHTFCSFCIRQWKERKNYCPICRIKIRLQLPTKIIDTFLDKLVASSSDEVQSHRKVVKDEREENEKNFKPNTQCGCNSCEDYNDIFAVNEDDDDDDDDDSSDSFIANMVPFYDESYASTIMHESDLEDMLGELVYSFEGATLNEPAYTGPTTVNGAYYGGYGRCFTCGETGHWRNGCPQRRTYGHGACFTCGDRGHWANTCPNRFAF